MKIVYIADDGTIFDEGFKCIEYEIKLKYGKILDSVQFFDDKEQKLNWSFDESFDNDVFRIIITSNEQLEALYALSDYGGNPEFEFIDEPGTWEQDEDGTFNKIG